MTRGN
jgi:4F5 protein related disordered region